MRFIKFQFFIRKVFIILVLMLISTCIYRSGDPKVYSVISGSSEGEGFILSNKVKYLCNKVWDLYGADITKGDDCKYIQNADEGILNVTYNDMSQDIVAKYEIKPDFSLWQAHGIWLAVPLLVVVIILSNLE